MYVLMEVFGAICLLSGVGSYLRIFLRRSRYDDPLDYACAASLSRTLDRRLAAVPIRAVGWLKFYANILLPYWGIAGGYLLAALVLSGGAFSPAAALWASAGACAMANLLFFRFYDRLAFLINCAACLTTGAALFLPPPAGLFPRLPYWLALASAGMLGANLLYFQKRRELFCPVRKPPELDERPPFPEETPLSPALGSPVPSVSMRKPAPTEEEAADSGTGLITTPGERLERMLGPQRVIPTRRVPGRSGRPRRKRRVRARAVRRVITADRRRGAKNKGLRSSNH